MSRDRFILKMLRLSGSCVLEIPAFFLLGNNTKIIVTQFYDNGKYFWKEYDHWLPNKKNLKIYIDPKNPLEDIDHERR